MRTAILDDVPFWDKKEVFAFYDSSGSRVTGNHFCLYFFLVFFFLICSYFTTISKNLLNTRNFHAV